MLHEDTQTAPELAEALLDAMSAVRRALRRQTGPVAEVAPLSTAQVQLVRVVHRRPGVSVADAADELGVAANTVSTLVRQLVDAGVLERRSSPPDRRVAQLSLNPAVAEGLGEWMARRSEAVKAAAGTLGEADRDAITAALAPLTRLAAVIGRSGAPN